MKKKFLCFMSALLLASCEVNPAERNNAGNGLYEHGEYEDAVEAYQLAQVVAPDSPEPYYNAASAMANTGRLLAAVDALKQALKTADENLAAEAYYNLGNIYFDLVLYDQAIAAYREVLLRRPDDADARHNYELALLRRPTPTPDAGEDQPATPTENPDGQNDSISSLPGATPTPQNEIGDGQGENAAVPTTHLEGSMSIEDAERILDAVQQSQQTLGQYLQPAPRQVTTDKDW